MTLEQILKPRLAHHILLSLLHKPHYREKWMRHVQRRRGNEVNQRAVASFIASQLSDQTHQEISPASIKDRISRALTGDVISDSTAQMFITAFEFAPQEVQELQRALLQHQMALKIAQADDKNLSSPSDYTIMSSFLEAYIDEYGYITHFISTEVIRAEADVVTEFFPRFESETAWLSLLEGGELAHISTSKRQDAICGTNTFWKMKVTLEHPLTRGQVH
ncbi:MAG: hypothetical protein Q3965_06825, partial [Rothia sp. (in: high G+C Gram-positive bacteria)]|nr:hypothetical protein [Rothia sp. (in: high G+C Gram-positive bacteria)]